MGCTHSSLKETKHSVHQGVPTRKFYEELASETHFSLDEVYALEELFNSLSNTFHLVILSQDGLIHKDEFSFALFKTRGRNSIFVDKVFQGFDIKRNDVIDFEEFVQALSVFHPRAGLEEKAKFAFSIYDLDNTNYIEPDEVKRFLTALLKENPMVTLESAQIDGIIEKTFKEADLAGDGHISLEEWLTLVRSNPSVISYMTLPVLQEVTTKYPSFLFNRNHC